LPWSTWAMMARLRINEVFLDSTGV
jgi:hypothetical protein